MIRVIRLEFYFILFELILSETYLKNVARHSDGVKTRYSGENGTKKASPTSKRKAVLHRNYTKCNECVNYRLLRERTLNGQGIFLLYCSHHIEMVRGGVPKYQFGTLLRGHAFYEEWSERLNFGNATLNSWSEIFLLVSNNDWRFWGMFSRPEHPAYVFSSHHSPRSLRTCTPQSEEEPIILISRFTLAINIPGLSQRKTCSLSALLLLVCLCRTMKGP